MYAFAPRLEYRIGYSARSRTEGREVMFFRQGMTVPELIPPLRKVSGDGGDTQEAAA